MMPHINKRIKTTEEQREGTFDDNSKIDHHCTYGYDCDRDMESFTVCGSQRVIFWIHRICERHLLPAGLCKLISIFQSNYLHLHATSTCYMKVKKDDTILSGWTILLMIGKLLIT